jgi:hypothetical protein
MPFLLNHDFYELLVIKGIQEGFAVKGLKDDHDKKNKAVKHPQIHKSGKSWFRQLCADKRKVSSFLP